MTVHDQHDKIPAVPAGPPQGRSAGPLNNSVSATWVSGAVVQAGSVTGGVHHHHPAPEAWPVPRQLPPAPPGFVGRTGELAALTAAVDRAAGGGTLVISALAGAGGIGKTWLAVHWAHRNVDRFPDGQLFVDLRGFSPAGDPMQSTEAVRGFLDAFGVAPARIPADPHAQAALYRSLLAGRRMLVVLDNAATAAQVVPLLPGNPACTVVVTSRRRLAGLVATHGAHPVHLDFLAEAEARRLFATRLPERTAAEADAVDDLLAFCGGFPLALAVVAGHARAYPRAPLATLAADLRDNATRLEVLDGDDRATGLPAVLSWSHDALTPQQRETFGLLGTAPGPDIGLPAVADLTGLPAHRARRLVDALEEASLLDHDGHGRWRMHDLVRAYAATTAARLDEGVRQRATGRLLDHYAHTAHAAAHLLSPLRHPGPPGTRPHVLPDAPAALAWFDREHANLLAAHHAATTRGSHRTAWELAFALYTFHVRRGHRQDLFTVWRAMVDAADHLPDPITRIRTHRFIAHALALLGRHDEATAHLHRAAELAQHHDDPAQQAHALNQLARVHAHEGDHATALRYARRALHLYRPLELLVWEATALNTVARCAAHLGEHATAREHCEAALGHHLRHGDVDGVAESHEVLGYLAHHAGDHRAAVEHYNQSLDLRRDLGDTSAGADTLDGLGHPLTALGHHERACEVWKEAEELYRAQGRDADATRALRQREPQPEHQHRSRR
ncbi:tetratricopeptide repeat protein [Actinosynnema sp. NPDC050436]|uniref:ATP-binding protein n=1 Tax=Actinosynnema sp. NPDC050436 TaxID=3155659 RepID=UPI0033DE3F95